jgi:hypothetical protein
MKISAQSMIIRRVFPKVSLGGPSVPGDYNKKHHQDQEGRGIRFLGCWLEFVVNYSASTESVATLLIITPKFWNVDQLDVNFVYQMMVRPATPVTMFDWCVADVRLDNLGTV